MSVRKTIANKAFGGRQVLRRAPYPKIQVVASGTGGMAKLGMLLYSSSGDGVYIAIDTAGTGTKISA